MSSNKIRKTILEKFDMSLGTGLGKYADKIFRIGHLGYFNDLMLTATLSGVEMGLMLENIPLKGSGTQVALDYLAKTA
jgi:alanine-glyoxylate transaminase/serine-glyoxylate transaminase/serine-pyruvate transaminase